MKNVVKKGLALSMTAAMLCSMSVSAEGEYKDTLVWGQGADVTSMDTHQGKEIPTVEVTDQIFDTLLVVNPETNELELRLQNHGNRHLTLPTHLKSDRESNSMMDQS